ncbi:hypothetical protein [Flavihumibacter sp. UBA7668]|uniref:hypothetical protein n=1 Tax=Flavihumibacter sp. UBA7668 TaxID=1946542 RepID=UPI0025BCF464|nr:hypothetical protein [Flavihumibacter sp. UBA7668]
MALLLLTQTELHQLLKLPILVEHFQEHKALNKDISLLDFLKEHYLGHTVIDNDYQRDMQLPFKTTDCVSTVLIALVEPVNFDIPRAEVFIEREFNLHKHYIPSQGALNAIFQPPRLA